ncbi:MAG: ATP-binding protein [Paludibacteraceae bacterium]|nr:ATP-binding protein [Paludibacteraceae bacterium]
MQKISIQNFGPIKKAEIELSPLVVLIGEQASGKSTIAKLVYFFKSLSDEFLTRYYQSENKKIDYINHVIIPIRAKFYDLFGSTFHLPNFTIKYWYNESRNIELTLDERKKLNVLLSDNFFSKDDGSELQTYKERLVQLKSDISLIPNIAKEIQLKEQQTTCLHQMTDKVNSIFCNEHNDSLFVIAGRNAMVGYSETFEKMLFEKRLKQDMDKGKRVFETKDQTIDETLMLAFMQKVTYMRQLFNKFGNFEGLKRTAEETGKKELASELREANNLINKVIKGSYASSEYNEQIFIDEDKKRYVYLKDASSGQQESIRILQDAFLSIYSDNSIFRIIEEPEAHLYPEAQMYLLQLLSLMLNHKESNQLIITTHSPYVLSIINNLMYAYQIGQKNFKETNQIINGKTWLNPSRVKSYMLSNGSSEDIIDKELYLIKAEKIDGVSIILNEQFDKLLNLENNEN